MIKHTHHIIPKHAGGTDDPTNLIELTIEEHAEAHRLLYEQYGRWQDKVAWQGLLGLVSHEEILLEMYALRRGENNHMWGKSVTDFMTTDKIEQWRANISKSMKGRSFTDEHRENLSKANLGKRKGVEPWNKGKVGVQPKSLESKMKVSKPIIYKGIEYYSIKEASRINNTTPYYIKKEAISI